jgi:oligopeptide transport system substrate-binding protein
MMREFEKAGIRYSAMLLAGIFTVCFTGCNQIQRPKIEPFYANTSPPRIQELKWSNGKSPKSLDPAQAAAPPETDLVRAVYEGLTDLDSKTLDAVPAVAFSWQSTKDFKTWTFHLRRDAKWSNGELVTAKDFVRSWKRLADLRTKVSNSHLFQQIVGMNKGNKKAARPAGQLEDFLSSDAHSPTPSPTLPQLSSPEPELSFVPPPPPAKRSETSGANRTERNVGEAFGVIALDDQTLQVTLNAPDRDFPKLVANPLFRPIYGNGINFESNPLDNKAPTNGPFTLKKVEAGSIMLERSDTYWNRESVSLAHVQMIAAETAEAALQAYRRGEIDVVTNVMFEPVAVKLLAPYDDFRRTPHNALNFYEVNTAKYPFSDRRIRQALSMAVDREKLTEGDLEGTTQPAYAFSPLVRGPAEPLSYDVKAAVRLLENAGFPDGDDFPTIRLVINRNDVQQRIASSVARMWKQNLNINTEIVVKEASEMDKILGSRDFDLMRRGVVLASNDEAINLIVINRTAREPVMGSPKAGVETGASGPRISDLSNSDAELFDMPADPGRSPILSSISDKALYEMTAIPLYYPISYSLIKPYVRGFEVNGLDAPSLKEVSVDNDWQPGTRRSES